MKWLALIVGVFILWIALDYDDGVWWHPWLMGFGGVVTIAVAWYEHYNRLPPQEKRR